MLPLLLLSCSLFDRPPAPLVLAPPAERARPTPAAPEAFVFDAHGAEGTYSLPASSRPQGATAPGEIELIDRFVKRGSYEGGFTVWRTALPVAEHLMPTREKGTHTFGSERPPGFEVLGPEGEVRFKRYGEGRDVFGYDRNFLMVSTPSGQGRPQPEDWRVRFPRATQAEDSLNFSTAERSEEDFVVRTLTVGTHSHRGLFLPPPAQAAWTLSVPTNGRLGFRATIMPPAIKDRVASDGAEVIVELTAGGTTQELARTKLALNAWAEVRVDVSPWAGQEVRVSFRTEAGESPLYDYVFLEAPLIYEAKATPRRMVLLFLDTLRQDHLGLYGYERDTSPNLDGWAQEAAVFTQARSVAPWTLPSARAMLSGRQPEAWYEGPNLPQVLSEAGWRTDAFVTNAFLSQPFDMHQGWDRFSYDHLAPADEVVARAVEAMARWPDRDTLVLVHLMEAHLPYREPRRNRALFAGDRPPALKGLSRKWLTTLTPESEHFQRIRSHVVDRYDQNIRTMDEEIAPLFRAAGPEATVVMLSDHGEEFWDHGGFEHGHAFYDELLHVPLAIRSPGLQAGRYEEPVSLLDVTPTLLELAGLDAPADTVGSSLVGLSWLDEGASEALRDRPQGFGRPLYGEDGWGVLTQGKKWWERGAEVRLFSVEADPLEALDLSGGLLSLAPYQRALQQALGREVRTVWRVRLGSAERTEDQTLRFAHPLGLVETALAYDPRGRFAEERPEVIEGEVLLRVAAEGKAPEQLFLWPPVAEGAPLTVEGLSVEVGGERRTCPAPHQGTPALCVLQVGDWRLTVSEATVPVPAGVEVSGFHPDMAAQLEQLGYFEK